MEANKNTPAFPVKIHESERLNEYKLLGLTKREMFAMAAMQGILAKESWFERIIGEGGEKTFAESIAYASVKMADELLKQLDHGSK
jgi:hypothetical protein